MKERVQELGASEYVISTLDRWLDEDFSSINKDFVELREILNPGSYEYSTSRKTC